MTVEYVLGIVIVAALVAGVVWNHRNGNFATAGVEFRVPASADVVTAAVSRRCCTGLRSTGVFGIKVRPDGRHRFTVIDKLGDRGVIEVTPAGPSGTVVRGYTDELVIGAPKIRYRSGLLALSALIVRGIYRALGIAPGAVKMVRFQRRLEGRILSELSRVPR
jgi:hypothetical protein